VETGCARKNGGPRAYVALNGAPWLPMYSTTLAPLRAEIVTVAPWPAFSHPEAPFPLLDWLGRTYSQRPLLGLTKSPMHDEAGYPQRGASRLGSGIALVSSAGLECGVLAGVIRHEVAHALGLPHCAEPTCALSERPHPLDPRDRPSSLCAACEDLWRLAARRCGA
jgi:hypothetical protein